MKLIHNVNLLYLDCFLQIYRLFLMKNLRQLVFLTFIWTLFSLSPQFVKAQSGANFKFGPTIMLTEWNGFTADDQYHNGWQIGIKGRIGRGLMYFNPGFFFKSIQLHSSNNFDPLAKGTKMNVLSFPVDMGFRILQYPKFTLRMVVGASLNYIQAIDNNDLDIDLNSIYDVHLGGDIGIGFDFNWITLDFAYEKGLLDAFKDVGDSKADYANVSLGFFF